MSGDDDLLKNVKVRRFNSFAEIQNEPGYIESNPVNKENYDNLIGDYKLKEELLCCAQHPNTGHLCNQKHNTGYVVRLKDGTVSILGNTCINSKFDPDSKIISDSRNYKRKQDQLLNIDLVAKYASDQEEKLSRANAAYCLLMEALNYRDEFLSNADNYTINDITKRVKAGNRKVFIESNFLYAGKEFNEDDWDDDDMDDIFFSDIEDNIFLGNLKGLDLFDNFYSGRIKNEITAIVQALNSLPTILSHGISKNLADNFLKTMEKYEHALSGCDKIYNKYFKDFINQHFLIIYFLPEKTKARNTLSMFFLEKQGRPHNQKYIDNHLDSLRDRIKAEKRKHK